MGINICDFQEVMPSTHQRNITQGCFYYFPAFSDATVHTAMSSPCTASSHAISVKAFRWRTRSDHVTRNALAARNNEVQGQGNGSPSLSLKTLDTGILFLAVFTLELERDYPDQPVYSRPLPHSARHPFSDFFLREGCCCTQANCNG